MKRVIFILFILAGSLKGLGCQPSGVWFGEITFIQDTINPLKFYFKVRENGGGFCHFQTDTCSMQWTCPGTGYYGSLPLIDTQFTNPQMPFLTYGAWHTFDTIPPDSLVYVSFTAFGRANAWNDGAPAQTAFNIEVTLNMAYLSHHTGVKSAYFNAPIKAYGVAGEVMYFDPQIQSEPDDSLWVTLTPPEDDCNSDAGFIYPNQYMPSSHNVLSMYNPTGLLIWDKPPLGDANTAWDIAYLVSGYREGVFAYSIMRDMIIDISYPSTGVSDILGGAGLKCYPSPTSGNFTIDMTGYDAGEKQISIYNQLGQIVYQTVSTQDKLQMNEMVSGVYTISVKQNARSGIAKLVVSNSL